MIVRLDDERALDPDAAGVKGAGLARALADGLPVPGGFVVQADELDEDVAGEVIHAYGRMGSVPLVAVRGPGLAVLDCTSSGGVLHGVRQCWAVAPGAPVVVQHMVAASAAGEMTCGPEAVITAVWGYGAGDAEPDELRVAGEEVIARTLGAKATRVVLDPAMGRGTAVQEVPAEDRERFALTDEQAVELAVLGRRAGGERMSWALGVDGFVVLQIESDGGGG